MSNTTKYIIDIESANVRGLEQPGSFEVICGEVKQKVSELIPDANDLKRQLVDAMCQVGQLSVERINDDWSVKALASLAETVISLSPDHKMVKDMFGFINDISVKDSWEEFLNGMLKKDRKAFLYFAGDLKIKSVVYVLRIKHFIAHFGEFFNKKITLNDLVTSVRNADVDELRRFYFGEEVNVSGSGCTLGKLCDRVKELSPEARGNVLAGRISEETVEEKYSELAELLGLTADPEKQKSRSDSLKTIMCYVDFLLAPDDEKTEKLKKAEKLYTMEQQRLSSDEVRIMQSPDSEPDKAESYGWLSDYPLLDKQINIDTQDTKTDLLYYLFMNNANEVIFTGVEHNWFWRYRRDKQTLFRCCGTNHYTYIGDYGFDGKNGVIYFQNLLTNTVAHMSKMSKEELFKAKLASYSKFPLYDISTYVRFDQPKGDKGNYRFSYSDKNIFFVQNEKNKEIENDTLIFALVKNADTNIVKPLQFLGEQDKEDFGISPDDNPDNSQPYKCASEKKMFPFSAMIQDKCEKGLYGFCLDVMSGYTDIERDKRHVFNKYLTAMVNDDNVKKLAHIPTKKVGEVVMLGNTCDAVCKYDGSTELNFDSVKDNVEYQIELDRWDVIALFYRIAFVDNHNANPEQINKRIRNCLSLKLDKERIFFSAASDAPTIEITGLNDLQKKLLHQPESGSGSDPDKDKSEKEQYEELSKDIKEAFVAFLLEKINGKLNELATKRKLELIMSFITNVRTLGQISPQPYKQKPGNNSNINDKASDELVDFFRALFLNRIYG